MRKGLDIVTLQTTNQQTDVVTGMPLIQQLPEHLDTGDVLVKRDPNRPQLQRTSITISPASTICTIVGKIGMNASSRTFFEQLPIRIQTTGGAASRLRA